MAMDGMCIIQNLKTMYEHKTKPFSPKPKPWTPRTKPWTQFQDLYILGDFSNPKTKVTRTLLLSFNRMCEWFTIKHKHKPKISPLPCLPYGTKPQILFKTQSSFMHPKHFLHAYLFQLLIHIFQHLKNKR